MNLQDTKTVLFDQCRRALDDSRNPEPKARLHAFIPGRIEVLGKHTDYCGGRSLVAAVERGFCVIADPRPDPHFRIIAAATGESVEFPFAADVEPRPAHWSNYLMTAARRIARNFPGPLKGANIAFASDLPPAAGLSSSSALITAMTLLLIRINSLDSRPEYQSEIHSQWDLCGYLGTVENGQSFGQLTGDKGVGTFGGSQDHTAILCSRPNQLSQIAFNPVRLERQIPFPENHCFAIASSGVLAEKTGSAMHSYNNASLLVRRAMDLWRQKTARPDITLADAIRSSPDAFDRLIDILKQDQNAPALIDRVTQFRQESEQVIPAAADALLKNDLPQFGQQVDQSQHLTETLLKNQVPETIHLAHSARQLGALAASAFGAGFGGSVWALIPTPDAADFLDKWRADYRRHHPEPAQRSIFFLTLPGPGAAVE
jgi:galactokinase